MHPFLKDFGQPARADACECERGSDSTLEQALQIVGGRTLHSKVIAQENRIGKLLRSGADDATLVEQLFLATLSRPPVASERKLAMSELATQATRPPAGRRGPVLDPAESPRVLVPALRTRSPVLTTVAVRGAMGRAPRRAADTLSGFECNSWIDVIQLPVFCHKAVDLPVSRGGSRRRSSRR